MFNGSTKVIGNKENDNKDPKNKQKVTSGVGSEGSIGPSAGKKLSPQNGHPQTSSSVDQGGDAGVKMQEKRQKKVLRSETMYSDKAIAAAKGRM